MHSCPSSCAGRERRSWERRVGPDSQGGHIQRAQMSHVSDTTRPVLYSCARLARRFFWCTSSPDPTRRLVAVYRARPQPCREMCTVKRPSLPLLCRFLVHLISPLPLFPSRSSCTNMRDRRLTFLNHLSLYLSFHRSLSSPSYYSGRAWFCDPVSCSSCSFFGCLPSSFLSESLPSPPHPPCEIVRCWCIRGPTISPMQTRSERTNCQRQPTAPQTLGPPTVFFVLPVLRPWDDSCPMRTRSG